MVAASDAGARLDAAAGRPWERFCLTLAAAAASSAAAIFLFVLAVDPYGLRVGPGRPPAPIMDLNQRFMYPQIVRSGRYDSAVFGTSTVRLLDPQRLDALFGARFANLGLNAGTPWEQIQLARLLLGHVRQPKVLIFGLDLPWCSPERRPRPPHLPHLPGLALRKAPAALRLQAPQPQELSRSPDGWP